MRQRGFLHPIAIARIPNLLPRIADLDLHGEKHTIVLGLLQGCSPAGSLDQLLDVEWPGSDVIGVRGRSQSEVLFKLKRKKNGLAETLVRHVVLLFWVLYRPVETGEVLR